MPISEEKEQAQTLEQLQAQWRARAADTSRWWGAPDAVLRQCADALSPLIEAELSLRQKHVEEALPSYQLMVEKLKAAEQRIAVMTMKIQALLDAERDGSWRASSDAIADLADLLAGSPAPEKQG